MTCPFLSEWIWSRITMSSTTLWAIPIKSVASKSNNKEPDQVEIKGANVVWIQTEQTYYIPVIIIVFSVFFLVWWWNKQFVLM